MDENTVNIKKNTRILLARNTPVALIIGAASFLGSHLADKLLLKDIQVIGVDDLTYGKKENLTQAIGNKNFHLIIESSESLDLELDRLDYVVIIPQENLNTKKALDCFREFKPRLLLISSVDLYSEEKLTEDLRWLKKVEVDFAKAAKIDNLNARILRLGPVYGPRMGFDRPDVVIRLIQQSLTEDLQKDVSLEFSSRAIFIDDACDLAIKCIFAGATAQKIFDGSLLTPIKVTEIKQVLLDPIWYENKNFIPTELPPWPTPNLEKTIKLLNWHPKSGLIESLKQTLSYFKDSEIKVPKLRDQVSSSLSEEWKTKKIGELEGLKESEKNNAGQKKAGEGKSKFSYPWAKLLTLATLMFIGYALIWPLIELGWGIATFKFQLAEAIANLEKGEFEKSLSSVKQASNGVKQAKAIFYSLEPLQQAGLLRSEFEEGERLANLATLSADSAQNTILGIQALYKSLKSVTGELNESPADSFLLSRVYLASADEDLSKADVLIKSQDFKANLPKILKTSVDILSGRLALYSGLVKKARTLSVLLPEIVALDGKKDYLVLLQNNNELRPTGGFIGSFAKVSFEAGKLKKLEVNDTYVIDGQLNMHVEPPKEIKEDLNQKDYFLRDANWEPDFPTSARQVQWFYTKETSERVEGVVALDVSAIEDLLASLGPLDLPDYNEKVSSDNLFERAISHAEINFFPGTQAKKSFLTALTTGLFNKLFFLPNQNWPGIVTSLNRSLREKHMIIYLNDQKLFSYIISQNWGGVLPRSTNLTNGLALDFLAPVEANLGANKANYYIERSYGLETVIGKDGEIKQRLKVAYTNRSPSDTFPAGKYKNRMRVYFPMGTKLNRALWGEKDITKDTSSFIDYGRSGYSFLLELYPKEKKTLILDYQVPLKLNFVDNKAIYRLDVVKQAGTLKDPFTWSITYPINVRLVSNQAQIIGPQEQTISTDLSTDRSFEVEFKK